MFLPGSVDDMNACNPDGCGMLSIVDGHREATDIDWLCDKVLSFVALCKYVW